MERIMKRSHQPPASWGKGEGINLTLLQLSSVPLIGQTQIEVKEQENSFMQSIRVGLLEHRISLEVIKRDTIPHNGNDVP